MTSQRSRADRCVARASAIILTRRQRNEREEGEEREERQERRETREKREEREERREKREREERRDKRDKLQSEDRKTTKHEMIKERTGKKSGERRGTVSEK